MRENLDVASHSLLITRLGCYLEEQHRELLVFREFISGLQA
jgi:hypothetical protein